MSERDARSVIAVLLAQVGFSHEKAEELVQRALDTHAHELAEMLRAGVESDFGQPVKDAGILQAADLIDPEVSSNG